MDITSFREKTSWKVVVIIAIILLLFGVIVYGLAMKTVSEHKWLRVECNVNMIAEFKVSEVASAEHAKSIVALHVTADEVNASVFNYCGGYNIMSGEGRYFLCTDGRFYRLTHCHDVKKGEGMPFLLPDPRDIYGD